jgi:hypothetical protein
MSLDGLKVLRDFDGPLDRGIKDAIFILRAGGIDTFESCERGDGQTYAEPIVRFYGDRSEGFRALAIAMQHSLPVASLRRVWSIVDGEPTGPVWEIVFHRR